MRPDYPTIRPRATTKRTRAKPCQSTPNPADARHHQQNAQNEPTVPGAIFTRAPTSLSPIQAHQGQREHLFALHSQNPQNEPTEVPLASPGATFPHLPAQNEPTFAPPIPQIPQT